VYGCVCDTESVGLPVTVRVELDVTEGGIDILTVNESEPVGDPDGDLFKLAVKSPVADKLTGDEGVAWVDEVKPKEGVARGVSDTV
jgi:hypothetical protein